MELKSLIPLTIPIEVLHQIQYLCKNIPKVEWSGALFYTTEGSIEKPDTFKITLKTILPLDMGTQGYTEYNLDSRFMDFIEEDFEERSTWKLGHIHSHNTMGVFFSGTDMAELNDNAGAHNYYLSLIVNNYMDFTAKVAFIAEAKKDINQVPYTAKNSEGKDYIVDKEDFVVDTKKLFIYNCDIISSKPEIVVAEDFKKQVAKIMEPKPEVKKQSISKGSWTRPASSLSLFEDVPEKKQHNFEDFNPIISRPYADWFPREEEEEDVDDYIQLRLFAESLFNFTGDEFVFENLEEVLDLLEEMNLTPQHIAHGVMQTYSKTFNTFFPDANNREFVEKTGLLIDILEEEKELYPFIGLTIKTIKAMLIKFTSK
jgi:hypothetical protein